MWHVPSERITLDLDGPSVEVERLHSWMVQFQVLALAAAYNAAKTPAAEYAALAPLFERFVYEAQPSWSIADHRGAIPCTAGGMARLPIALALQIVTQWLGSLEIPAEAEPPTAIDAIVPPGPVNRELKRRLKKVA